MDERYFGALGQVYCPKCHTLMEGTKLSDKTLVIRCVELNCPLRNVKFHAPVIELFKLDSQDVS